MIIDDATHRPDDGDRQHGVLHTPCDTSVVHDRVDTRDVSEVPKTFWFAALTAHLTLPQRCHRPPLASKV